MNIKKIFVSSLRTAERSRMPVVRSNMHTVRLAAVSLGNFFEGNAFKRLGSDNGNIRIYELATDYFSFGTHEPGIEAYERYLRSVAASNDLTGDEIAAVNEMFKLAALEKLSYACKQYDSERDTAANERNAAIFISHLNFLEKYDGGDLYAKLSHNERIFKRDKTYHVLDRETKNIYRHRLSVMAKKQGVGETELAEEIYKKTTVSVGKRAHIGYWLFDKKHDRFYIPLLFIASAIAAIAAGVLTGSVLAAVLSYLPLFEIVKIVVDRSIGSVRRAEYVPRLEKCEKKTLVTIVTFISSPSDADKYAERLKQLYYTNKSTNANILFGFLADLPESPEPNDHNDAKITEHIKVLISKLNAEYENVFFAAVRKRSYNSETGKYSGYERKRGAICDFLSSVKQHEKDRFLFISENVFDAKYFVSLDSDTVPEPESIAKLICVLDHPNAEPVYNSEMTAVIDGYAVAVPRIDISLKSAVANGFTRVISCFGGTEVYENVSFDLYQNIFGEGIFSGKGAVNIDAFNKIVGSLFGDNRVLSHDILEGCFLRTVSVSDAVFGDSVPKNIVSYLKRSHRWIRGDWQNIRWLKNDIITKNEITIKNPLGLYSKFKLLDNLRRSVFSLSVMLLLFFALAENNVFLALTAVAAVFAAPIVDLFFGMGDLRKGRYVRHKTARAVSGTESFLFSFLNFMCLPSFAYNALDAVVRALYRSFVSGKKLLEWTTADASDKKSKGTFYETFFSMLAQSVGIVFFLRALFVPFAVLWVFAPAVMFVLFRDVKKERKVLYSDFFTECMADIWKYFETFLNEKNNYLPPDNFQQAPVKICAQRTSPTNIGLSLLCTVGARDMGFISAEKMFFLLDRQISSIESLERSHGHFLNWYETTTKKALRPRFISTVDNGNLAVCLYTLKNALLSFGGKAARELANRVENILAQTDFAFLYDKKRQLFRIGYDVENLRFTDSHYDLYASESRLTSYFSVANGTVPKKHWATLDRFYTRKKGYLGVKSWSGTMFEYFLPHIFLPVYECSLDEEMLRFAFDCQKSAAPKGIPWGVSESAYYAFDRELNYQYKAFGVRDLAVKHFANGVCDSVVSPYSSFIALPVADALTVKKNLELFSQLGAKCEYGFYDAVDYMSFSDKSNRSVIMNSMVHHLGMSFLACENYLKNNIVSRRFMDERMSAFSSLLQQRPPAAIVHYGAYTSEQRSKNDRYRPRVEDHIPTSEKEPILKSVTGGGLSDIITDSGNGYISFDGKSITKMRDMTVFPKGIFALLKTGSKIIPFTFAPLFDRKIQYKTFFEDGKCVFFGKTKNTETRQSITVDALYPCEIREYSIKNNVTPDTDTEFLLYLEPVLADSLAERAHPAFSSLFTEAFYDKQNRTVYIHRRPRNGVSGSSDLWLAVSCDIEFEFELSRFNVLKRGVAERSLNDAFALPFSNSTNGPVDACVAIRSKIKRSKQTSFRVFFAVGHSKTETASLILRAKDRPFSFFAERNAAETMRSYSAIGAKKEDIRLFELIFSRLFSSKKHYFGALGGGIDVLWKYGVSGDFPIILVKTDEENTEKCDAFVKAFILLKNADVPCELVICFSEGGSYERRIWTGLRAYFRALGREDLIDRRNGAFLANIVDISDFNTFRSVADFYIDLSKNNAIRPLRQKPPSLQSIAVEPKKLKYVKKLGLGGFTENGYGIDDKSAFPYRPAWSHVLSNPVFGTVLTESDLGFTFARNAALNKLTPWSGDPVCGCEGEKLFAVDNGKIIDLVSYASVKFMYGSAEYLSKTGNTEFSVKIFVPQNISAKIFLISVKNSGGPKKICFYPDIIMNDTENKGAVFCERTPKTLFYTNPYNNNFPGGCAFVSGEHTDENGVFFNVKQGEQKTSFFVLGYEKNKACAMSLSSTLDIYAIYSEAEKIEQTKCCINIKTPNENLDLFYNNFLLYQTVHSRLYAKSGFYQCGGAFGFRDQLQDCICVSSVFPQLLKRQIIRAASHQFADGDVLHWWHSFPSGDRGTRTRFSDDLLWLPYAVCEYVKKTGKTDILKCKAEYIVGRQLDDGENEAYIDVQNSGIVDTVFGHCVRAIKKACTCGHHGLVLFGCGDWNDGMNGLYGGESMFTTMFAIIVLERFAAICDLIGENDIRDLCIKKAAEYRAATEKYGYENDRFVRGFFKDGTPLGSEKNIDCKIDLLPQSFAAIAGGFDEKKVKLALETAEKYLVDRKNKIVKLFSPPFYGGPENPGYIKGYVPGVRENGGQYTHAAVWFSLAHYKVGDAEKGFELLDMLNPVGHTETLPDVKTYRGEPYVLSADVYSNPSHVGMAGWSQYTGAAGWFFKVMTEELLGIKRKNNVLYIEPSLPRSWNGYGAQMDIDGTRIALTVEKDGDRLTVDGKACEFVPLDGKRHTVSLTSNKDQK